MATDPHPSAVSADGLEISPFRALCYRDREPAHLARVSSPAYDLVTPEGRARLLDADPCNVVRLILPQLEPRLDDAGDPGGSVAEAAGATLARWIREEILVREDDAALWVYEMTPADGSGVTVGWVGAVTLPGAGSTAVLPHEDTFADAVEGRRALLASTGTDLEPIVLAHDDDPDVANLAERARGGTPTLEVDDSDEVRHRLWRVTDPEVISSLVRALRRTRAVIADGHHRFAAARAHAARSGARAGHGAILAMVTPMGPGGLQVAPIHRVVPGMGFDAALAAAAAGFEVRDLSDPARRVESLVEQWVQAERIGGPRYLVTDGHRVAELSGPSERISATVPAEAPAAWRHLDVVLAHTGLLTALWLRGDDPEDVLIAHSVADALQSAQQNSGVALLLRAASPGDVAAVARAGARMPRKSTLFVPKPRTGLLMRPLAD